ncbi:DUF4259 domain-containing protein [Chryseolinea soli]|uniref:DUF4259 domain-containing protein n=1 Tax=Chryseolinea soli TaxID=2321403 RepID=A0A385SI02_9BACT|nr:DUF4259 domain-containing protein [Chryseolinea soli]AYB30096.1 DUF4259 domain-containing protein [Chryseolinea soli]
MGTWGHGNFENDSALDWVGDFEEKPHKDFLEKSIRAVLIPNYIDAHDASVALAALEVVAWANGKPAKDFPNLNIGLKPDDLRPKFDKDFYAACNKAVDTVMRPTNNEIMELWEESGELDEWRKVLEDLRKRIQE